MKASLLLLLVLSITLKLSESRGPKLYDVRCKDPRPQFCTEEYAPVCGYRKIECFAPPCDNYATYGNACAACSDKSVLGYTKGACVCGPYRH